MTNEELLLTAQHIEQHRHATYLPDPYYQEGLKRDPGDSRINDAYGMLLFRRGDFSGAEKHFRAAVKRLTWRSPNPFNSEPYYNLGLALFYQDQKEEAFDAFYKATWSNEQQEMSFYYLAAIETGRKNYESALELIEKGLVKNAHNVKARGLKAAILRKSGNTEEAKMWCRSNLETDPFDYLSMFELAAVSEKREEILQEMNHMMRGFHESYLQVARDYAEAELYEEALAILEECKNAYPLLSYYRAWYLERAGKAEESKAEYRKADKCCPLYCFPNKLEDIAVLNGAIESFQEGAKAYYYLGNLYYDKLQFEKAINLWEKSVELDASYPTAHRNLALAYFNKQRAPEKARAEMEKAFSLDETDARVFLELDQLYKKLGVSFSERLKNYEAHRDIISARDDVMLEYVTLYNLTGMYEKAYDTIMSHEFRPWEGAEGRISGQYKIALLEMAKGKMAESRYEEAEVLIEKALTYPQNLGEGRLEGTKDNNLYYYLGIVKKALGKGAESKVCFEKAEAGENEPAGVMYYYDQPADMILYKGLANLELGNKKAAYACFNKLMDYGERHLNDEMKNDFFAVSLPDFLIFEDDMDAKNRAHCYYLMGLADLGFGRKQEAGQYFKKALENDYNHQNCRLYMQMS